MRGRELAKQEIFDILNLYNENPFTEFNIENLKPIRQKTGLGYNIIQKLISTYIIVKQYACDSLSIFDNMSCVIRKLYEKGYYKFPYIYILYILEYNTNTSAEHL